MTRLGVDFNEFPETLKLIKNHSQINCEGIYSHFSTADEGDLSYAHNQLEKFNAVLKLADDSGILFRSIHCSNSGALLNLGSKKNDPYKSRYDLIWSISIKRSTSEIRY
ncbi:MAG: hypothetical protein CM1200mP1_06670 [Candidatus Neomarinimicrobiota bacterium]|nr:MAG: hypothetical protein CM1200mP1_06670 [Candidatus Neomarinimicrobiota bacterium]